MGPPPRSEHFIYLDHAASSPLLVEARDAMVPFLDVAFANPSATYGPAREARRAIDDARDAVASFARCAPGEIVFTSGGTEADNLALAGSHRARPGGVVVSAVEHDAVAVPAAALGAVVIPVDASGLIDLDALAVALDPETTIVSVIAVQSETGVVSPLSGVAAMVRERAPAALLHTDAVQGAAFFDLGEICAEFDLVSISAHKIGGPKGTGALIVRDRARGRIAPLILGGGQERELRAGTENVAGIVGFGAAAAAPRIDAAAVGRRRDLLWSSLVQRCPEARLTAERAPRSPGICHVLFPGVVAEELLVLLDDAGVAASAGSACASGALEPSHVLDAMGWDEPSARQAIRFSLGRQTTDDDVERGAELVVEAVRRLRGI